MTVILYGLYHGGASSATRSPTRYRVFGAVSYHSTYIRKKSPVANIGMLSSPLRHFFQLQSRSECVLGVSPVMSATYTPFA